MTSSIASSAAQTALNILVQQANQTSLGMVEANTDVPTPNHSGGADIKVIVNDTLIQDNPEFLTMSTMRSVSFHYSGKHDVPTFGLIQRLMDEYVIPKGATMDSSMNFNDLQEKLDKHRWDDAEGTTKRTFYITFTYPIKLGKISRLGDGDGE
jgi:hypothetical protein